MSDLEISQMVPPAPEGPILSPVVATLIGAAAVLAADGTPRVVLMFIGANGQPYSAIPNDPSDCLGILARSRFATLYVEDEFDPNSVHQLDAGDDANSALRTIREAIDIIDLFLEKSEPMAALSRATDLLRPLARPSLA